MTMKLSVIFALTCCSTCMAVSVVRKEDMGRVAVSVDPSGLTSQVNNLEEKVNNLDQKVGILRIEKRVVDLGRRVDKLAENIEKKEVTKSTMRKLPKLTAAEAIEANYKFRWFNRDAKANGSAALEENDADDEAKCEKRLNRFKELDTTGAKREFEAGEDKYFPDDSSSIAEPDAECGDSAHGIHKSCNVFNHWQTMQSISKEHYSSEFSLFNPATGQPAAADVQQGQLGTCYFLATLIAVVHVRPDIIKNMFVRDFGDDGIVTTKWWVNGKESLIEVGPMIPAGDWGNAWPQFQRSKYSPYFAGPTVETKAWWPAILEKSWAKIFGNYKATDGGNPGNVLSTMTRSVVKTYAPDEKTSKADIWNTLETATKNRWPIAAASIKGLYGLAGGHAYAFLGTVKLKGHDQAVKMMNPWNSDYYKGDLAALNGDHEDGTFYMTLNEFYEAFTWFNVAQVYNNYHVTSAPFRGDDSGKFVAFYEFEVTKDGPLDLSVVWSNDRLLKPCDALDLSQFNFAGGLSKPSGDVVDVLKLKNFALSGSNSVIMEISGKGVYRLHIEVQFPKSQSYIHQANLVFYSEDEVVLKSLLNDPNAKKFWE